MRVLRLSGSDDYSGDLPAEARPWHVAGEVLAAETGEPVETTTRRTWPTPALPDLVDSWLDRYEPEMVFLKVNAYWYTYESVPLRVRRKLPLVGRPLAAAGEGAAQISTLSRMRAFKASRHAVHRLIGGDTHFSCDEVIERMQLVIRRVVAREDVVCVVKCGGGGQERAAVGSFKRFTERREYVEGAVEEFCRGLGVYYTGVARRTHEELDLDGGDGVHRGAVGLRHMGLGEGAAMVAGWRAAHADTPAVAANV